MKKINFVLIIAIITALMLVSCSSGEAEESSGEEVKRRDGKSGLRMSGNRRKCTGRPGLSGNHHCC